MKPILGIVFCRCEDDNFDNCPNRSLIRAVGNVTPDFPDEPLFIKHCNLKNKEYGSCPSQIMLDRFPRTPIFFYRKEVK